MSKSDFILSDLASNGVLDTTTSQPSQQEHQQPSQTLNPHQKLVDLQVYTQNNAAEAHSQDLFQSMEPNLQYRSGHKPAARSKL
ncbi:hypothetical protein EMPS_08813 [Entomortierella parvispora]|uniref:Uncharacterized protein n=1 Tax=Entomortierella parvispora TaxID=205924 RepID=A0A9P3HGT4_9FUNG|nr:hypothetical protein EMPS_08813 [Entomortierella parvispora]